MAEERIGKNGEAVGTAAYFEKLNRAWGMDKFFPDPREHHYLAETDALAGRVNWALDELHRDLKDNALNLPYIHGDLRKETADFVRGLDGVCSFLRKGGNRANDCLSLLELRDYGTRPKSRVSVKEITAAAAKIQKLGSMWRSDIQMMLKKARDYGLRSLSGDAKRVELVKSLSQKENREFYGDVLRLLDFEKKKGVFAKCGRILCSREYIVQLEGKVFFGGMSNLPRGGRYGYVETLRYALCGVRDEIDRDLFANGQMLSVENLNKLQAVSGDFERLIGRGFPDRFKSAITNVRSPRGLLLERDAQVLNEDDMALMRALNNEYLYYEQQGNEPVMRALGYEAVKIRRRDVYFDQYNRGPYANLEGYEADDRIDVKNNVLGLGDVWVLGGETDDTEKMEDVRKELSVGKLGGGLNFLLFFCKLYPEQRAKACLEIGDVWIQIADDTNPLGQERHSWYKRDGTYITSSHQYLHASTPLPHTINPDIELESQWNLIKEYAKELMENKLLDIAKKGIPKKNG